jgi:hypothetical protein
MEKAPVGFKVFQAAFKRMVCIDMQIIDADILLFKKVRGGICCQINNEMHIIKKLPKK